MGRYLIINADGYGITRGINRAIEECIAFGTVRSLSANVNFPCAAELSRLVREYPFLSVGCHLNPIVGCPILPPEEVPSLVNEKGEFFYKSFRQRFTQGHIRVEELRAELMAQIRRTAELAGDNFTHVDFHMGLHRLPRLYPLFLEVALASGVGRIRTHRYILGLERSRSRWWHLLTLCHSPKRVPKYLYNLCLRRQAQARGLAMPDAWIEIFAMDKHPERISVENYIAVLQNLPEGYFEFVAHPAYVDEELRRWATYVEPREREREVLLSLRFREALTSSGVQLAGHRDIPIPFSLPGRRVGDAGRT